MDADEALQYVRRAYSPGTRSIVGWALADEVDRLRVRATQLENALRSVLDAAHRYEEGVYWIADEVIDEARSLLDGDSAPTDTEDPDA